MFHSKSIAYGLLDQKWLVAVRNFTFFNELEGLEIFGRYWQIIVYVSVTSAFSYVYELYGRR